MYVNSVYEYLTTEISPSTFHPISIHHISCPGLHLHVHSQDTYIVTKCEREREREGGWEVGGREKDGWMEGGVTKRIMNSDTQLLNGGRSSDVFIHAGLLLPM